ncbi:MAG TPA: hypothetical protein PKY82_15985 [Pyrinomonadaceae bacterium]|nr:hypothetical protein [Pyrinomonadaceae bacterium]
MDEYILQLSMDLDEWTGKVDPKSFFKSLKKIWDDAGKGTTYITDGRDDLIKHLKQVSIFKDSDSVRNLKKSDFTLLESGLDLINFIDLARFLRDKTNETIKKSLVLVADTTSVIQKWLKDDNEKKIIFVAGTTLEELWDKKFDPADFDSDGIQTLVTIFRDDEFLSSFPNLKNHFTVNAVKELDTVGSLVSFIKDNAV